jgi:hypothetical protein
MTKIDVTDAIKPKSDQLNADDLIAGAITVTITSVSKRQGEQPVAVSYEGDNGKPFYPCKSMTRVLVHAWGKYADQWAGKRLTLYRDPKVTWAGAEVGGIRISHMSDIPHDLTMSLTASKQSKKPYTVKLLTEAPPAPKVDKSEAAKKKAAEIIAEINSGGDVDVILQREAAVIERFRNAYSGLYNDIINASTAVNFSDEEIPA